MFTRSLSLAVGFAFITAFVSAADSPLVTHMTKPGQDLLIDDLTTGFGKSWKVSKGKWDAADGGIRVAEVKADMHGAVARSDVKFTDAVIAFSFKLDGAKLISLSLNGAKGHINRVQIRATGFSVNKDDQDGKNGPDKGEVLGKCDTKIESGKWHHMVLELHGGEMLAVLNGEHVAYGASDAVKKEKTNIGLTCAGEFAAFKNISVREATANPNWAQNKSKLLKK